MTLRDQQPPRYLLLYFLPVALTVAIAAAFSLSSLHSIRQQLEALNAKQVHDVWSISQATRFTQELGVLHRWALAHITGPDPQRSASDIAAARQELQQRLDGIVDLLQTLTQVEHAAEGAAHTTQTQQQFQTYRQALFQAFELAHARPEAALRHAHAATDQYIGMSEHAGLVLASILRDAETSEKAQFALIHQRTQLITLTGAFIACVLLLGWYLVSRAISRRLGSLSSTVRALAGGDINPTSMAQVHNLARRGGGLMAEMARACIAFRDNIAARESAQFDLTERVKEQTCLYDIFRMTEDDDIRADAMVEQVLVRLPAAMRYPDTIRAHAVFDGRSMGAEDALELPHAITTSFDSQDGTVHHLRLACTALPADGSGAFLPEEEALLEAVGMRLSSVLRRRRAKRIEKDNQALMDIMVEESPIAIELVDAESLRFVLANATACSQLGYSKEALQNMTLWDVQGMFTQEEFQAKVQSIVSQEHKVSFENRRKCRNGALIDVQVDVHMIQRGTRKFMVTIWSDITARKQSEAQIRMLSMAVDQSPNTVLITDMAANTVYVNNAFTRITGYSREEVLGQNPRMLKSGKTPASTYDAMWRALTAGDTWTGELINRTKDGREQIHSTTIAPIRGEDGKVCQYVAVKQDVTQQRRNEDLLRKLSLAVDQSPESIVITNLDAQIEYVNQAFIRNTGYSWDEAIGANPRVLQSGKTPLATYQDMWATLTRGQPWRGDLYNARKDGSEYVEHAIIAPVRQPSGMVTHYLAIKEDVTEKRRMSDELEAYRTSLEQQVKQRTAELGAVIQEQNALFDSASVGIVLVRDRTIVRCNHRMDEMFGYAPGELVNQPIQRLYPTDVSFEALLQQGMPTLMRGLPYVREDHGLRKDGTVIWARSSAHLLDVAEPSRGLIAIVEDTTAERAMLDALRLAHEEQQAIFDSASVGMALVRDRAIIRSNRRMDEMLGYEPGEQIGKPVRIWYPDDASYALVGKEGYEVVWRGDTDHRELQLMRKDGSLLWVRMAGRAIDITQPAKGVVAIIEDITAERAAVQAIRKAQEMAEEAARVKADFLANMSHEIRTPMNAVIGMTHLVLKTDLTTRQHQYLTKIQDASKHLLGIINDILDFSKIEAGKLTVEQIEFELDKVLDNVINLIADRAAAKGLELIVNVDPHVPNHLVGDPLRIGQVLINYANNAVKFTDHGEIAIQVRVTTESDRDLLLHFSVQDTGPGIAEEHLQHLFQSFQQADSSTTRKFGGTGLGLAIAKRLAELMGGAVGVESEPGRGSTFWFTARLGRGREASRNLLPDPDLRGRRVLVVDDNESTRDVIADMLRSMSFQVGVASSGKAAVMEIERASTESEPYEIVFLDWLMPGMDGVTAAREIRRLPLTKPPHLIMITAHGREEIHRTAEQAGIEDVLTKPLNPSLLFDTVMHALSAEPSERTKDTAREAPLPSPELATIRGARALLVEDNELNQEVAVAFLHDMGLEVDVADNGRIAVNKVRAGGYDVVLMDMQMPVLDGLAATREIRQLPGLDQLPIIAMTANALEGDRERCIEAGMNDHVAKPIDPDLLARTLLRWVEPPPQDPRPLPGTTGDEESTLAGLAALDGIDGLDPQLGLRQSLGRAPLYLSLLDRYRHSEKDWTARMESALKQSDMEGARRLAHTLKGVSAQVGAHAVQTLAQSLEQAIAGHQPTETIVSGVQETGELLARLLEMLEKRLPEAPPVAVAVTGSDRGSVTGLCGQLLHGFEHDDFASAQRVSDHEEILRPLLGADFGSFSDAVRDFDFATAQTLLKKAMHHSGIDIPRPA